MSSCDDCDHNWLLTDDVWKGYLCCIYGYEIEKIPLEKRETVFKNCKYAKIKENKEEK